MLDLALKGKFRLPKALRNIMGRHLQPKPLFCPFYQHAERLNVND